MAIGRINWSFGHADSTGDAWITEGNYRETFGLRLPRADAVIILERSRWLRLWRVLRRGILARSTRPDPPAGCPEHVNWGLLKFIWRFDKATWPRIDAARIQHGQNVPVIRLRTKREIASFFASRPEPARQHSAAKVMNR